MDLCRYFTITEPDLLVVDSCADNDRGSAADITVTLTKMLTPSGVCVLSLSDKQVASLSAKLGGDATERICTFALSLPSLEETCPKKKIRRHYYERHITNPIGIASLGEPFASLNIEHVKSSVSVQLKSPVSGIVMEINSEVLGPLSGLSKVHAHINHSCSASI